jgi:hypothetical protein
MRCANVKWLWDTLLTDILVGSLVSRSRLNEWGMVITYPAETIEGLVFKAPRMALGPTDSTLHCVPVFIPDGLERQGREAAVRFHLMLTRRLRGSRPPYADEKTAWFQTSICRREDCVDLDLHPSSPFVVLCLLKQAVPLPKSANGLAWDHFRT